MKADNKVTHGLFDVPQMRVEHGDQAVVDQGAEKTKVLKYSIELLISTSTLQQEFARRHLRRTKCWSTSSPSLGLPSRARESSTRYSPSLKYLQ